MPSLTPPFDFVNYGKNWRFNTTEQLQVLYNEHTIQTGQGVITFPNGQIREALGLVNDDPKPMKIRILKTSNKFITKLKFTDWEGREMLNTDNTNQLKKRYKIYSDIDQTGDGKWYFSLKIDIPECGMSFPCNNWNGNEWETMSFFSREIPEDGIYWRHVKGDGTPPPPAHPVFSALPTTAGTCNICLDDECQVAKPCQCSLMICIPCGVRVKDGSVNYKCPQCRTITKYC